MSQSSPYLSDIHRTEGLLFDEIAEDLARPSELALQNIDQFAEMDAEGRGAVFTRKEVVEFILDLVGYTADRPLHTFRALEPSCGEGDFLLPMIERLLLSWVEHGSGCTAELNDSIRAVDLHMSSYEKSRDAVLDQLIAFGISEAEANRLVSCWLQRDDFLLTELVGKFDFVVGNPPYVRHERVPKPLMAEYRRRYKTIYDRADLYVPFIERSLSVLSTGGKFGAICADRWMKNRYGERLRSFVSDRYHVESYVDMVGTPAFQSDVIAYPAITVISRDRRRTTRVSGAPDIDGGDLRRMIGELSESNNVSECWREVSNFVTGTDPWLTSNCDRLAVARRLESSLPTIEEAGCRVGIGVATGADRVFIGPYDELDVEPERKLRLATTRDIATGEVVWKGGGIVNPFDDQGRLVDLDDWPILKAYFHRHGDKLRQRHVAKKNPVRWYRTIDKISSSLTSEAKLLIPDIKGGAQIVYESGRLYPHHNLYYITSAQWDLHALQAVLKSGVAELFVSLYSTRMRGGYLRFQAQYLRRIRLPRWDEVPEALRCGLRNAAINDDSEAGRKLTAELYGLTPEQLVSNSANGKESQP